MVVYTLFYPGILSCKKCKARFKEGQCVVTIPSESDVNGRIISGMSLIHFKCPKSKRPNGFQKRQKIVGIGSHGVWMVEEWG